MRFRHGQFVPQQPTRMGPTERQGAILALLERAEDGLTLREICAQLAPHASERQVRRTLAILRDQRLAESKGRGPAARWIHL